MASVKDIAKGRSDVYRVSINDIHVKEGWNGREENHPDNIAHIDALAQSIAAEGVKETLTVYMENDKLYVENGHMRRAGALRAIEIYGAPADLTVPVQTSPKDASEADRILSQIIRNSGKQLAPLEMATVFQRLNAMEVSNAEIARRTGLSRVYVGQLLELLAMPVAVTKAVREGTVSATLAIQTMKANNGDAKKTASALKEALAFAKSKGKVKATAKHIRKASDAEGGEEKPKKEKTEKTEKADDERTTRKSSVTVMAEVRTIIETASTTLHPLNDQGGKIVMIAIDPAEYKNLVALLDLTVVFPDDDAEPTPEGDDIIGGDGSEVEEEKTTEDADI